MSSKIVNILIVIIAVEISIFLGLYLLSFEVFWFYMGITLTLTISLLILIFKIVLTSSQSNYSDEIIFESINPRSTKEQNTDSSNSALEHVVMEAKELKEVVLAQDANPETKVIELTNQFGSLVEDIKSRIEQERVQIETNELSHKLKDEYISDIKKTVTLELEKLNTSFEEKIDKFSMIEDTLISRLEIFEDNISEVLNHKLETALGNLIQKSKTKLPVQVKVEKDITEMDLTDTEITPKLEQKQDLVERDKETIIQKELEKIEPITTSSPANIPENERFDDVTEDIIKHVEEKYQISRNESIELLEKIESYLGKKLSNMQYRVYLKYKSIDDLTKILEKGLTKEKEMKKTPESDDKEESINLMGREIEILKIKEDIQEIEHKGNKFKMQKTMSGKTLDDFGEMEERIKKFFKKREILIVYCENSEKFFIYYKV